MSTNTNQLDTNLLSKLGFVLNGTIVIKYNGNDQVVEIPAGITEIGSSAFLGCNSITSVTLPETLTAIGVYAFRECTSLTSIFIPKSVASIGDSAFTLCKSLTTIDIQGEPTIGQNAFYGCKR